MSKIVFVDEQWFDHEEYDGYDEGDYEGFSELDVYDIEDYDEYDEDLDRDDYNNVGTVLVGFSDGDGSVLEVLDGDLDESDVELYYPPL